MMKTHSLLYNRAGNEYKRFFVGELLSYVVEYNLFKWTTHKARYSPRESNEKDYLSLIQSSILYN